MAYQDIHTNHLNDIIELVKAKKIVGENAALSKFTLYLDTVQSIGSFNLQNWRLDWRKKIWAFGELFKDLNPSVFLASLDDKLIAPAVTNKEVLEFIRSEIIVNFLPDNECKKQLENLIEKYPLNPEFRHTLGHYYGRENSYLLAISEYKLALKIEPSNSVYLKHRFSAEHSYLTRLIAEGEYQKGKEYLKLVFDENFYINMDATYHNGLVDFNARIDDHLIFQTKLKTMESDFKNKVKEELDNERKRIIEVLGFFSAIVAFILSTVSIGKNFSFLEATYFIVALGLILILFAITLSVLFSSKKAELIKDKKFWILIVGIILLFLFIQATEAIAKLFNSQ
ncbi:hypothetical protein [Sediminibacterium sp.]|uniref:tetratricopeptide repeat protein n=1 Tax=Sediminibacterium sp. TaxID=1917865 RepID=UPI0025CC727A|nr:hypothetical protein [Sediminibacterium sp.]MBW0176623.1 hypothetical protein [Sediminibacterium sp.]